MLGNQHRDSLAVYFCDDLCRLPLQSGYEFSTHAGDTKVALTRVQVRRVIGAGEVSRLLPSHTTVQTDHVYGGSGARARHASSALRRQRCNRRALRLGAKELLQIDRAIDHVAKDGLAVIPLGDAVRDSAKILNAQRPN